MQLFTIIYGAMLGVMMVFVSKGIMENCLIAFPFLAIAAIILPLCYLHALRHFVVESQNR
jgi:hypothetical protein